MKTVKFLSVILLFFITGCKNSNATGQNPEQTPQDTAVSAFTLPEIPEMLDSPEMRADFLAFHYWDNFDFNDIRYTQHPEISEQAFVDYIDLLGHVPLPAAQESIKQFMTKTSTGKEMLTYFTDLAETYLHDPNSPMRNEEFYIPVLECMIDSPLLSDTEKIRPTASLELAQKNRVSTTALDFTYTLASGATGTLHSIPSEFVIIYINNPGCHSCEETTRDMKNSLVLNSLQSKNKLKILAIYPDEELDEWKNHVGDFPAEWINGYDKTLTMRDKNLYDLKAIPSLYLLDKDKKVILKDADLHQINQYLRTYF
ncbi:MAG: DUF5106 domain-containing protein [Bacteroides sp.]|nr:DUF5106 domain-containing protein [Bacteroides sp.]